MARTENDLMESGELAVKQEDWDETNMTSKNITVQEKDTMAQTGEMRK